MDTTTPRQPDIGTLAEQDTSHLFVTGLLITALEHATGLINPDTAQLEQLQRLVSDLQQLAKLVPSNGVGTLATWAANAEDNR